MPVPPAAERTAELRWFLPQPPPGPVTGWFDRAAGPPEDRSDLYLVLSGTDALGVKLRGDTARLDLKVRPRPGDEVTLPSGVCGRREEWLRWTFSRPGVSRVLPRLGLPAARWVAVAKQRRLATVPFGTGAACRVELTRVQAAGRDWWTVAFESFGPEADLAPALETAVKEFFGSFDLPGGFGGSVSCGYPGWLEMLAAGGMPD